MSNITGDNLPSVNILLCCNSQKKEYLLENQGISSCQSMEVVIAMGHFCDSHGPCVILCTSAFDEIPENHSSNGGPICPTCKSIDKDTVYVCEDEKKQYITTRTSFDSDTAHLLKDAVLRSLSVEMVMQNGRTSGTMYFGDNHRGHIIAHVFSIKDSFARGFRRKYCIVVVGSHQISLLSHYDFLEMNLKRISEDLQQKADKFNLVEITSNREVDKVLRSLSELIGERNIFAQLHMWFVFLLTAKIFRNIPHNIPTCPIDCPSIEKLRNLKLEMPDIVYDTVSYCTLTGIKIEEKNSDILRYFQELLPIGFKLPNGEKLCCVSKTSENWNISFHGTLPNTLPKLHTSIKQALEDTTISNSSLYHHIKSFVMYWFNISCVLSWSSNPCEKLIRTLEIHKYDMPLISYWISQSSSSVKMCQSDYFMSTKVV